LLRYHPPYSQPDLDRSNTVIVPLCPGCAGQPTMSRINGCLGMMKKMYLYGRRQVQLDFSRR
jgi:hypothetical protein